MIDSTLLRNEVLSNGIDPCANCVHQSLKALRIAELLSVSNSGHAKIATTGIYGIKSNRIKHEQWSPVMEVSKSAANRHQFVDKTLRQRKNCNLSSALMMRYQKQQDQRIGPGRFVVNASDFRLRTENFAEVGGSVAHSSATKKAMSSTPRPPTAIAPLRSLPYLIHNSRQTSAAGSLMKSLHSIVGTAFCSVGEDFKMYDHQRQYEMCLLNSSVQISLSHHFKDRATTQASDQPESAIVKDRLSIVGKIKMENQEVIAPWTTSEDGIIELSESMNMALTSSRANSRSLTIRKRGTIDESTQRPLTSLALSSEPHKSNVTIFNMQDLKNDARLTLPNFVAFRFMVIFNNAIIMIQTFLRRTLYKKRQCRRLLCTLYIQQWFMCKRVRLFFKGILRGLNNITGPEERDSELGKLAALSVQVSIRRETLKYKSTEARFRAMLLERSKKIRSYVKRCKVIQDFTIIALKILSLYQLTTDGRVVDKPCASGDRQLSRNSKKRTSATTKARAKNYDRAKGKTVSPSLLIEAGIPETVTVEWIVDLYNSERK